MPLCKFPAPQNMTQDKQASLPWTSASKIQSADLENICSTLLPAKGAECLIQFVLIDDRHAVGLPLLLDTVDSVIVLLVRNIHLHAFQLTHSQVDLISSPLSSLCRRTALAPGIHPL